MLDNINLRVEVDSKEKSDLEAGQFDLPPLHVLSIKQISLLAINLAAYFIGRPVRNYKVCGEFVELITGFYNVVIRGKTTAIVDAKSKARGFWRRRLQQHADIARLNYEAKHRVVGGGNSNAENYASNSTVSRARAKAAETEKFLSGKVVVNIVTGQKISMYDLANKAAENRFNELYWISKNFEAIAEERGMGWLFVTYTAPPEYHPNPLKGKCSYNPDLGVKASHLYIASGWSRVRALLSKRGIKTGIDSYFGIRIAETHKDGAVHWHMLVFILPDVMECFVSASEEQFATYGQMKVVRGDPAIGCASSYIFKYLAKGFDSAVIGEEVGQDVILEDEMRESSDLASVRNGERVRAALQAMRIRQYQVFGVKKVLSLIRAINKIKKEELQALHGALGRVVEKHIWRNETGLKFLLQNLDLITKVDGDAPLMVVKEKSLNVFGEEVCRPVGLRIGEEVIRTKGRYQVEKA